MIQNKRSLVGSGTLQILNWYKIYKYTYFAYLLLIVFIDFYKINWINAGCFKENILLQ